jgi:hypothetical protein
MADSNLDLGYCGRDPEDVSKKAETKEAAKNLSTIFSSVGCA